MQLEQRFWASSGASRHRIFRRLQCPTVHSISGYAWKLWIYDIPQATDVRWYPNLLRLLSANDKPASTIPSPRTLGVDADLFNLADITDPLEDFRRRCVVIGKVEWGIPGWMIFPWPSKGEDRNPGALSIGEGNVWVCADAMIRCYIFLLLSIVNQITATEYRNPVSVYLSFPAVEIDLEKVRPVCASRSSAGQVSGLLPYPKPRVIRGARFYLCRTPQVARLARNKTIDVARLMKIVIAWGSSTFIWKSCVTSFKCELADWWRGGDVRAAHAAVWSLAQMQGGFIPKSRKIETWRRKMGRL